MSEQPQVSIIAIITTNKERIAGGGAPVFISKNKEELQQITMSLGKIMDASAHEVDTETMIIVKR